MVMPGFASSNSGISSSTSAVLAASSYCQYWISTSPLISRSAVPKSCGPSIAAGDASCAPAWRKRDAPSAPADAAPYFSAVRRSSDRLNSDRESRFDDVIGELLLYPVARKATAGRHRYSGMDIPNRYEIGRAHV